MATKPSRFFDQNNKDLSELLELRFDCAPGFEHLSRDEYKTTACRQVQPEPAYLNWDDLGHRRIILAGPDAIAAHTGADQLCESPPVVLLDEIHKHARWKGLLKVFSTPGNGVCGCWSRAAQGWMATAAGVIA